MEEYDPNQLKTSKEPQQSMPIPGNITPEILEQMKQQAREMAVAQYFAQQQAQVQQQMDPPPSKEPMPQVVYVRRNLTIAELIVVFVISCGIVGGIQVGWNFVTQTLPKVEIRVK